MLITSYPFGISRKFLCIAIYHVAEAINLSTDFNYFYMSEWMANKMAIFMEMDGGKNIIIYKSDYKY